MEYLFVGIDISQDTLDASFCNGASKEIIHSCVVDNSIEGIDSLLKIIKEDYSQYSPWFCFEHTGVYGLLISHQLNASGLTFSATSALQIKRSIGITRGKNDKVDAIRIATYAAVNVHLLVKTDLKSSNLQIISSLLSSRQLLIKNRTASKNHLRALVKANQCFPILDSIDIIQKLITQLDLSIKEVENKIDSILLADQELQKSYSKLRSIPGIGRLTAVTTILMTNNFTSFTDPRKFNSYCGVAPFAFTSGSSIKGKARTSSLRNKELKHLLFTASLSAIRCDHQIGQYYQRKLQEGKHKLSIRNAIACKLISRMFAVIKRDEPYVNLAH